MILTRTPLRIGLLGGGTDIPDFYSSQKCLFFGGSINKYVYVISNKLSKFSQEKYRFTYRNTESVDEIEHFKHPVTREALKMYQQIDSINLATMSDIPGGTGLGSSSAFTVGLIKNLDSVVNIEKDPMDLAREAIFIERNVLRESGGVQDQIYSSVGGLRFYSLYKDKMSFGEDFSESVFGKVISSSLCLIRVGGFRESQSVHFSLGFEGNIWPPYCQVSY
jgi:D-glycero-alpha-D-manno-heptose-7-phosphate kinase